MFKIRFLYWSIEVCQLFVAAVNETVSLMFRVFILGKLEKKHHKFPTY